MIYRILKKINFYLQKVFSWFLRFAILPDFIVFNRKKAEKRFSIRWKDFYPEIRDKTKATSFDRHYLYHTAWAVRKVKEINPILHIDIGSSLYFSSLLSAFIPAEFYDYRPPLLKLDNLGVKKGDLLHLPFEDGCVNSISCMHTVEHIGLGRYGEPIDPAADLKAIKELKRVLAPGGSLLFVVPIGGKAKIAFNAHRIYTYEIIMDYFKELELREFSLILEFEKDGIGIITSATREQAEKESYGCGCFWFIKK